MNHTQSNLPERQPLPQGAVIEFCEERAVVMRDPGGEGRLSVNVGEYEDRWWWTFEGVSCSVVSLQRQTPTPKRNLGADDLYRR